jgi:hypothetical protein
MELHVACLCIREKRGCGNGALYILQAHNQLQTKLDEPKNRSEPESTAFWDPAPWSEAVSTSETSKNSFGSE